MGNGIAHVFAQRGHDVTLVDAQQDGPGPGREHHREQPGPAGEEGEAERGRCPGHPGPPEPRPPTWRPRPTARLVVEAVFENFEVKRDIFTEAGRASADQETILASNTSSISLTKIAGCHQAGPIKVIGMHFMNPVPIMKLVEVICGQATSAADPGQVRHPVGQQGPGQGPRHRAGLPGLHQQPRAHAHDQRGRLLPHGGRGRPARPSTTVMKLGMAHPMGPLTLADFIGLDICLDIMERAVRRLRRQQVPALPAAAAHGGRRLPGTQERQGILRLRISRQLVCRPVSPPAAGTDRSDQVKRRPPCSLN